MMRLSLTLLTAFLLAASLSADDTIDGRVFQVELSLDDVLLEYVETRGGMSMELSTPTSSVKGVHFYVGDGKVAVTIEARPLDGILFQGKTKLKHGHKFRKGSEVDVLPGFKKATDLKPGEVYVVLPGVQFKMPAK